MPPPLEIEIEMDDEDTFERQEASSDSSDEEIQADSPLDIDFPEDTLIAHRTSEQSHEGLQQESQQEAQQSSHQANEESFREASPVPLVTSDIITKIPEPFHTAGLVTVPKLAKVTTNAGQAKGTKRRRNDTKPYAEPPNKRRKGNVREMPCVQCVRRIANDPKRVCHDAIVGQSGYASYYGSRCDDCIVAHVTCHQIPAQATQVVQRLVKAAAEAVAASGPDRIQLLATYEAAIGPALRAIATDPEPPQKRIKRAPGSKSQVPPSERPSKSKHRGHPTKSFSPAGRPHQQQQQQYARADQSDFFAPPRPQQHHQQQHQSRDVDSVMQLERQALRRRKVEALESISHTAALFLAEFMAFTKQQSTSTSLGGSSSARNSGMDYAAAAAGMAARMFQPPADGHAYQNNAVAHSQNTNDSDSDSSDVSTIENNVGDGLNAAHARSTVGGPADQVHQGRMNADFGSDGESDKEDDAMAQQREVGSEETYRSELKVEDA